MVERMPAVISPLRAIEAIRQIAECRVVVEVPDGWDFDVLVEYARRLRARAAELHEGTLFSPSASLRVVPVVDIACLRVMYTTDKKGTTWEVFGDKEGQPGLSLRQKQPFHLSFRGGLPVSSLLIAATGGMDITEPWKAATGHVSADVMNRALVRVLRILPEARRELGNIFSKIA